MSTNPLLKLNEFGQVVWLDYIRRNFILSGDLEKLIREDALRGVTSNPSIFEKAIAGSHDYDEAVRALSLEGKTADEIIQAVFVEDVRSACDRFRPVFDELKGGDGFVSLEVSPRLARDTMGTIEEARRLWTAVDRPNVMIKVPATAEGIPAIRQLTSEGINVNITLLFGLPRYREVIEAYLSGLEERARKNLPVGGISSVASFFLSRIDTLVDPLLEKIMKSGDPKAEIAKRCLGRTAIASAKIAYQIYKEFFNGGRFRLLAGRGARTQRLLWASTSTKNPAYPDTMYVEELIGPETINTVPVETMNAYRDHGHPALRLEEGLDEARSAMMGLIELGISIDGVTAKLEEEGIRKFEEPFAKLVKTVEERRRKALEEHVDSQTVNAGREEKKFQEEMGRIEEGQLSQRLWRKDPGLWKPDPENQKAIRGSLGWLHVAEKMEDHIGDLRDWARELKEEGFRHAVHMGMGGSSLAPLVLQKIFPQGEGAIPLTVLDTTNPSTIRKVAGEAPLEETVFIVASKSGTTAEPIAFGDYFYEKVKGVKGDRAGENFVVITDPGTPLVGAARERRYRRTFLNYTDIGGRYSALSFFGLVPAALMGIDLNELLARALRMEQACAPSVPLRENPGIMLGSLMGSLALGGRDKLTFLMPGSIGSLGMWLEQLLAESTGKEGRGILPVTGEPAEPPQVYGDDRLFACYYMDDMDEADLEKKIDELIRAGYPTVRIRMEDPFDVAQEFYRWEVATATAGAVLGINAFNQPNVQESKDMTNKFLAIAAETNRLPEGAPVLTENPLSVFADETDSDLKGTLRRFLRKGKKGDYLALQAYLAEDPENQGFLQDIRAHCLERLHVATTLGYGPRFLHSTGQYHKGGPNTGLFLQLTADEPEDAPIPGHPYTFGTFIRAQALGDYEALKRGGRRVMRVHLGADAARGLEVLKSCIAEAIG